MTFAWTDDAKTQLRTLFDSGLSYSKIAAELGGGLTKNAVIAKADRLGFQKRYSEKLVPVVVKPAPPPRLPPIVETAIPKVVQPLRTDAFVAGDRKTVGILELRTGQCRWPFGDRPYRFCGSPTVDPTNPECPYCAEHRALARSRSAEALENA